MAVATARRQPSTVVVCSSCRRGFELSMRSAQRCRSEGREPRCRDCRRPPHPKPTEQDRQWWRERFTLDEIRDMATAIFG